MNAIALAVGFIVVLLDDLFVSGDLIEKGESVEVERAVRNDWIGSKLARDATDEEVAAYRAAEAEAAADAAAAAAADADNDAAGKTAKRATK